MYLSPTEKKRMSRIPTLCAKNKSITALLVLLTVVSLFNISWSDEKPKKGHHGSVEMVKLLTQTNLPFGDNGFFTGSGRCGGCHGDDPIDFANINSEGSDVSPATNWRGTMMANSAKDPFWKAKVNHEILVNPAHSQELVNKCTSCHAPVGRFTNLLDLNNPNYTMEELALDSLALDGVNCGACHQQKMDGPQGVGKHFSGDLFFHRDTIYGPFITEEQEVPIFEAMMQSFVGYRPLGHAKMRQSETCAGCHSLSTHTADLEGNYTGNDFIEQATYHEWLNSSYNDTPGLQQECQGCHMPETGEGVVIASGYLFLPQRQPYGQHWLVGGNTFMLGLLKNNAAFLGVTATEEHFNTAIERTTTLLQTETALVALTETGIENDTAKYSIKLSNLAGHKFPSGYPSRRAYVEIIAVDDAGNEIFHSGKMDNQYRLVGEDNTWEPHYDLITSQDQVQIYEMVMGDVNGNRTTVLERADVMLKDNRLTPIGFSVNHASYDTTKIVGDALYDPNFNHFPNGNEGSGTDQIRVHIPLNGFSGNLHVTARLMYQTVPPKYLEEMFTFDNEAINSFRSMYDAEGADPVQVGAQTLMSTIVGVEEIRIPTFLLFPNPTSDGWVNLTSNGAIVDEIAIYSIDGRFIERRKIGSVVARIQLPETRGTYFVEINSSRGRTLERVIRR
ncbi:MAG: T9SS type A sorting domain-containing protein [Flavobacteriales bacterium]|jgi:hypothetical protein|nr:T9SS type A sorting domain-containing protein [Flavobacteriales bacterium]MDP4817770.1 T9SS type A sorting domain-containing protein [Flavobacteriales bacterium]